MIRLAHLSDPHIAPMPAARFSELLNKRALGFLNWHRRRISFHLRSVLDLLVADLRAQTPDHTAVTGDLVNLSLRSEFKPALDWLGTLGPPDTISVVPGNHDAYVPLPWQPTLGLWANYMTSCTKGAAHVPEDARYPYVRIAGEVALIGVSTAVPTPPFCAFGTLGRAQLAALEQTLESLDAHRFFRILLIHHPPLPHQASRRKRLSDAERLQRLLIRFGIELVLHGHNHRDQHETLQTQRGTSHIFGVPSASGALNGHRPAAQYNIYQVERRQREWDCRVIIRGLAEDARSFTTLDERYLFAPTSC